MAKRRTNNIMAKRRTNNRMAKRRTNNIMAKRRTNNIMAKRRTNNIMAKKRTNNIMAKRRTNNIMAKRTSTKGQTTIYRTLSTFVEQGFHWMWFYNLNFLSIVLYASPLLFGRGTRVHADVFPLQHTFCCMR